MKIQYISPRGKREFIPSITDEYGHRRGNNDFYEWQNALGEIACCNSQYPRVVSIQKALEECRSSLNDLSEDDLDKQEYWDEQIKHIEEVHRLLKDDVFFVFLKDCDYADCNFACAKTEEQACKNYLLQHFEDKIVWIKDENGDLIFGEEEEDGNL